MVTPELLNYVKGEVAKGRTREEIRKVLTSDGGWDEEDLSEAFRAVIPMQNVITPKPIVGLQGLQPTETKIEITPSFVPPPPPTSTSFIPPFPAPSPKLISSKSSSHLFFSFLKFLIIFIIVGGLGYGIWFYRAEMTKLPAGVSSLWSSLVNKIKEFSLNLPFLNNTEEKITVEQNKILPPPIELINQIKDCGISMAPDLDVPATYENDFVLACLGSSAINCEDATGVLQNDSSLTIFEIIKNENYCSFKLSYVADSILIDSSGKNLAEQYVSCPLDVVKSTSNTKASTIKFTAPDKLSPSKYAAEIYFYGNLGLFLDNNLDKNKIEAFGCSGEYIDSVIASYQKMGTKKK